MEEQSEKDKIAVKNLMNRINNILTEMNIEIIEKNFEKSTLVFDYKGMVFLMLINSNATRIKIISKIAEFQLEATANCLSLANTFNTCDFYLCSMVVIDGRLLLQNTIYIDDTLDIKKMLFAIIDEIISMSNYINDKDWNINENK